MPDCSSKKDLPPVRPVRPRAEECCQSGCNPCVFDLYEDALDRYAAELRAWEERQAGKRKNNS